MRIPKPPPREPELWLARLPDPQTLLCLLSISSPLVGGRYLHWDKVRFHEPPTGLTHEEWWLGIKRLQRRPLYREVPLFDKSGTTFVYAPVDPMPELLHQIDLGAGGLIQMPEQITNPETRDQYYVSSLIDEAITSSQLEGATTTRPVAKEMIKSGRLPRDRSEQMILNNYLAMTRIGQLKNERLDKALVFEIHRIVTQDALDDPSAAGRFRRADEDVRVEGAYGEIYHDPPSAGSLERRMEQMCAFANGLEPEEFMHPVLRAIILHFWLAYDHPFKDGNGRTARALFYWAMLHGNYWLCEFISISQIIRKAPIKYGRAFLYTETDDNDLTYFILYHLDVLRRAVHELHEYIKKKTLQLGKIEAELRGMVLLNHRQRVLMGHAIRHPQQRYTIESHRMSHKVVYQTARTDLLDLESKALLQKFKVGKTLYFVAAPDVEKKLADLGPG